MTEINGSGRYTGVSTEVYTFAEKSLISTSRQKHHYLFWYICSYIFKKFLFIGIRYF
jgi:hypothetical protein